MKDIIIDIEILSNLFLVCGIDANTDKRFHFLLWKNKNDNDKLYKFLKYCISNKTTHITFNGLAFDSQILQWMLDNEKEFNNIFIDVSVVINKIQKYAQSCITKSNTKQWLDYAPWKIKIPQLDLMKMGHWDATSAKAASLKWLECGIDWPNVEDMPYSHTDYIETEEQCNEIISYCYNDCLATKKIFHICKEAVDLRKDLSKEYSLDLHSASEPKMSKELFLHFLSQKMGKDKKEMKKWSTEREIIKIKDLLLPYIDFERQEFIMLLNNFKKLEVRGDSLKGSFSYNVKYKGISIDYGVGGIHAIAAAGIYKSTEDYYIKSIDVSSFYPNLVIRNKWAPAHIPKQEFCDQYEWFYEERKKHKKGTAKNKALKLLLNSTFGLSIDKHSFLSDPSMGVQITVNGQLLLSMLLEMICEAIPDSKPLVMNTDGIEVMIHKQYENQFENICKKWEKITNLVLEYDKYKTILSFDCNNYFGLYENNKIKGKGRFEFEPHDKYEIDVLHKNKTFLIVPKAIAAYYFQGINPETFVRTHRNIYDFCGFARAKGKWKFVQITATSEGVVEKPIQKTLRYFVSNTGSKVIKRNSEDKREINVLAGRRHITEFNKFWQKEWDDYNLDYSYYIKEIYKEIHVLEKPQLSLFN